MAGGELRQHMMAPDNYRNLRHVSCACSAQLNMCGGFVPKAVGVDIGEVNLGDIGNWCPQCIAAFQAAGCPRCGKCRLNDLCDACLASPPATD